MKRLWKRILAVMLVAALCLAPAAQALTTDQLKDLLGKYYINDIPQAALDAETIEEVIQALGDPYTMYLTPEEYAAFQASMSDQEVVGIGISAVACDDGLSIVGVYDGAPAQKLGLVGGDTIISVEGRSAAGQTAEVITGWLKGEAGSKVTFVVRHADGTEETYTATRAKVVIPSTTTEMLEDGTTGYIVCNTFGAETLGHFTEGTQAYDDANLWVVDLRQNGGGDVYAVTQTLGVFLGEGTMVYLRDGEGAYFRYVSQQDRTTLYPTIVLTSGGTASSAEIFSLAMKDKNGGHGHRLQHLRQGRGPGRPDRGAGAGGSDRRGRLTHHGLPVLWRQRQHGPEHRGHSGPFGRYEPRRRDRLPLLCQRTLAEHRGVAPGASGGVAVVHRPLQGHG